MGSLHTGQVAGSEQTSQPRSLFQRGWQLTGFPNRYSKGEGNEQRCRELAATTVVLLLLNTLARAARSPQGLSFFFSRGVETVFLVQTMLFDAGPSS